MTGNRKYDIIFDYPWSEDDEITIKLPAGFTLESPELWPAVLEPHGMGSMTSGVTVSEDRSMLTYKRTFVFGKKGELEFSRYDYSPLKSFFDAAHQSDNHAVILQKPSK